MPTLGVENVSEHSICKGNKKKLKNKKIEY